MKIIIAGAGKVGSTLARQLCGSDYELVMIDNDKAALEAVCEHYDVLGFEGNCAAADTLNGAGIGNTDLLIAATSADEINLLCCAVAQHLNPAVHTIARVRNPEYSEQTLSMQEVFGLSMTINPELNTAKEIEHLIRYPGFLRRDAFAKGRVEIVELRVDKDSPLNQLSMRRIGDIAGCRVLVCAVLRGGEAVTPRGDFVLKEGDRIFVTAPARNLTKLLRHLNIIAKKAGRVILCGGGRIGFYLARQLNRNGIETQIIESDRDRCEFLARELPETSVIFGDASNTELLEKEGLSTCGAVVTLTGQDEVNILISMYAKSRGVPQVITKQGHTERFALLDELSLGTIISPKELCSDAIVQYVRSMRDNGGDTAVTVQSIADGHAEASEFIIREDTPYQNVPLKDLKLKPGVLFAAVSRGRSITIAGGGSVYARGDSVIVISGEAEIVHFSDIFA